MSHDEFDWVGPTDPGNYMFQVGIPLPASPTLLTAISNAFSAGLDDGLFGVQPNPTSHACQAAYCHGYAYGQAARAPATAWTWAQFHPC